MGKVTDASAINLVSSLLISNKDKSSTLYGTLRTHHVACLKHLVVKAASNLKHDGTIQLEYVGSPEESNPVCRCPVCGNKGPLMDAFSLLKADFNGIREGSLEDLDAQECGKCGAILAW